MTSMRDVEARAGKGDPRTVSDMVQHQIERLLYREARLLDERRFHEWVDFFSEDAHYWMPVRADRIGETPSAEFGRETDLAYFDETKESLRMRARKLDTGMAWAEEPPSRTRHLISNVEVETADSEGEVRVYSNFLVYRTRLETTQDLLAGRREDILRCEEGSWKIARRTIFLDQTVLSADNLSVFL